MAMRSLSANRVYLALFFPFLPAERWLGRAHSKRPEAPIVFAAKQKNALRIMAACPQAARLGLGPGLALADARARVPGLITLDHDPVGDDALIARLADWCDRYTPMVAANPPYGLMLDVTGCGDAGGIAADACARLAARGLNARMAIAETPDKARAEARFSLPLPIAALELQPDAETALRRAGLRTVADLAARPRAVLAARFGRAIVAKLERVLGEEDVRITPRRQPPPVFALARFAEPVARTDFILAAIEGLVVEAGVDLAERGAGGRGFAIHLFRSDGLVQRLDIATGAPTRDPALILRLLRERLDALADPLDPGFGYDALRLDVTDTAPLAPAQAQLEGGAAKAAATHMLLDRLGVRLGQNRVRRFAAGDSHIPEQAAFMTPANAPALPMPWPDAEPGEPPLRPLFLYDPPQPIEVIAEVPDGPPRRFRWRRQTHDVVAHEGPERIASEWWRRKRGHEAGKAGLTRDYYRVEDRSGRRFWLFRHGLYGGEAANPGWYLHGRFV
jgi:protein ImuB